MNCKVFGATLSVFLVVLAIAANANSVSGYAPQSGDSFSYSETITVNNGQNSYAGYSD